MIWMLARLPETLPEQNRRPIRFGLMKQAVAEIFAHPVVRLAIVVQSLAMATLITLLMIVHQAYDEIYGRAASFPYWFGATALVSALASWCNASLVGRLGMRRLVTTSFMIQVVLSGSIWLFALTELAEPYGFVIFLFWQFSLFLHAGLTLGNLNAMGLEPMGHIAGMTASIMGGVSTVVAACLASPVITLMGSMVTPLVLYILALSVLGLLILLILARAERRVMRDTMPVFVRQKSKPPK